jgi:hypothetical protein
MSIHNNLMVSNVQFEGKKEGLSGLKALNGKN